MIEPCPDEYEDCYDEDGEYWGVRDTSDWPVMPRICPTCPLSKKAGMDRNPELANMIRTRCLTEASQICHHPRLHGKKETRMCRGARDHQLQVFYLLGVIPEPTDKAWEDTSIELKKGRADQNGTTH